jgi:hypothetical protein
MNGHSVIEIEKLDYSLHIYGLKVSLKGGNSGMN